MILEKCRLRNLLPVVQLSPWRLCGSIAAAAIDWVEHGFTINFLISPKSDFRFIEQLLQKSPSSYCTWIGKLGQNLSYEIPKLSLLVRGRLHLYFPYHHRFADGNFSSAQVHHQLNALREKLPTLKIRAPLGIEIWNNRIDPDLCLEPIEEITAQSNSENPDIKVSVIVPSYNNVSYLTQTLLHLRRQDVGANFFEVIVVDDGSSDNTHLEVIKLLRQARGEFNCKYIFFPRNKGRKMGDGNFRAGIARNLGAKNASGEILCFLDSDILTPQNFLNDLISKHDHFDVVQCTRLNLTEAASGPNAQFERIDPAADTFFTDGRYWETFYAANDWQSLPFFWKYTCTYGLSMRRDVFKKNGWLKRSFVYYGFEDTELGHRLAKAGYKFHLNPLRVYHLFHKNQRSEFSNQDWKRHLLLTKTARIFYQHVLESEIFEHFQIYLHDGFGLVLTPFERLILKFRNFKPFVQKWGS